MWPLLTFLLGMAAGALFLKRSGTRSDIVPHRPNIRVSVTYQGNVPTIEVDPWVAGLKEGDEVTWTLESTKTTDTLRIQPKPGRPWPFQGPPPQQDHGPGNPIPGGPVTGKKGPDTYKYDVVLQLTGAGNAGPPIRIDPDLIIIWD